MPTDFRTAPRYFVMSALPATLGAIDANVVDLSIRGARLHMTQPMSIGSVLPFRLQTAAAMITTHATVSWCRMAALALDDIETDRYLCGVMFDQEQPLVMKVIEELVTTEMAMRIEDSRGTERYVELRRRWDPYVMAFASYMEHDPGEIDPVGVHPDETGQYGDG